MLEKIISRLLRLKKNYGINRTIYHLPIVTLQIIVKIKITTILNLLKSNKKVKIHENKTWDFY